MDFEEDNVAVDLAYHKKVISALSFIGYSHLPWGLSDLHYGYSIDAVIYSILVGFMTYYKWIIT